MMLYRPPGRGTDLPDAGLRHQSFPYRGDSAGGKGMMPLVNDLTVIFGLLGLVWLVSNPGHTWEGWTTDRRFLAAFLVVVVLLANFAPR